jgi:hypothetical protein
VLTEFKQLVTIGFKTISAVMPTDRWRIMTEADPIICQGIPGRHSPFFDLSPFFFSLSPAIFGAPFCIFCEKVLFA